MARASVSFAESAARDLEDVRDWHTIQGFPEVGEGLVVEPIASALFGSGAQSG